MAKSTALHLSNLTIGYNQENPIVKSIAVEAKAGDLIAVMGLNGSGKTSLFKTILGEIPSLGGEITVGNSSTKIHQDISIVFTERISIYGFTVEDMVAQGRASHTNIFGKLTKQDKAVIQNQLNALDLQEIASCQINSLSDGQFQKVMIARALAQETPVLLLDEPTAFLDVKNKRMIHKLLFSLANDNNKTILVSTHDVSFCNSYCTQSWVIQNQELKAQNPKEITESFFD